MIFNFKKLTNKIIIIYLMIPFFICLILYPLLPVLLNYPADSINNSFQLAVDGITYTQQYIILVFLILLSSCLILFIRINRLNKYIRQLDNQSSHAVLVEKLCKIRSICLNTPFLLYYLEISIPLILLPITFIMIKAYTLTIIKICLIYISFFTLASVISFISSQNEFKNILINLHSKYPDEMDDIAKVDKKNKISKSLRVKLILQILPLVIIALIVTSLVGYTQATKKTGEIYYSAYTSIVSSLSEQVYQDLDSIKDTMNSLDLLDSSHYTFIISSDESYITSNGEKLTPFLVKYTLQNSKNQNGRTFDYYCLDQEGIVQEISTLDGNTYYVGILYNTSLSMFLKFILISCSVLLCIFVITLVYITGSLSKEIQVVTDSLNKIVKDNDLNNTLPTTSEDELKELIVSFNEIQKMTRNNINQIRENQDLLIEKERLASLGQMIGGIAHNLKTPIFSISGGLEGLSDLIKEYDSSIEDSTVTNEDMHEIAKDMNNWINKLKEHIAYMSDVITAVKGQAVALSEENVQDFNTTELFKYVDILMKHELKNSLTVLNFENTVDDSIMIKGNINGLVQVINNLISNAIDAYNGVPNKQINLKATSSEGKIIISVQDFGPGIPENVKNKLFKEMITTKGKNGTGLGLFMSYSNIKAHFNGDLYCESEEGKGSTFFIELPV